MRETHTEMGLGLTKKIIAHYGSSPSPTADGQPGREEGSGERKGEKTSALSLCEQQVEVLQGCFSLCGSETQEQDGKEPATPGKFICGLHRSPGQEHLPGRWKVKAIH